MPVYHKRLITPEIRGEEYHGPIDGVQPKDYPLSYTHLLDLRCTMTYDGPIYQNIYNYQVKLCQHCYICNTTWLERLDYKQIDYHGLIHERIANIIRRCATCDNVIMLVTAAHECRSCIEEYFHTDRTDLLMGQRIKVIHRWKSYLEYKNVRPH